MSPRALGKVDVARLVGENLEGNGLNADSAGPGARSGALVHSDASRLASKDTVSEFAHEW